MTGRAAFQFFLVSAIASAGCATATSRQEALKGAVEDFSRGVRWSDWGRASAYMSQAIWQQVAEGGATESDIRVTDVSLSALVSHVADKAEVTMAIEWYRLGDGTIQRTMLRQVWGRVEGGWRIQAQRTIRGAKIPLLPDAAPQSDESVGN